MIRCGVLLLAALAAGPALAAGGGGHGDTEEAEVVADPPAWSVGPIAAPGRHSPLPPEILDLMRARLVALAEGEEMTVRSHRALPLPLRPDAPDATDDTH